MEAVLLKVYERGREISVHLTGGIPEKFRNALEASRYVTVAGVPGAMALLSEEELLALEARVMTMGEERRPFIRRFFGYLIELERTKRTLRLPKILTRGLAREEIALVMDEGRLFLCPTGMLRELEEWNAFWPIPEEKGPFWDGHVHTNRSDGVDTPEEAAQEAVRMGIGTIAITDHNLLSNGLAEALSEKFPLRVIPGAEISALTRLTGDTKDREVHIVVLFTQETRGLLRVLEKNHADREPYLKAYLAALDGIGMDLSGNGSHDVDLAYRELLADNGDSQHVGRQAIARRMVKLGLVSSVEEAFRKYVGRNPDEERPFDIAPEDYIRYASLEEVMEAVRHCPGAVSVLCHPYYRMDDLLGGETDPVEELVSRFKALGGDAVEVFYGTGEHAYPIGKRRAILELCRRYDLLPTAASDHHNGASPLMRGCGFLFDALSELHERKMKMLSIEDLLDADLQY